MDDDEDQAAEDALADALLITYGIVGSTGDGPPARDRVRPQAREILAHLTHAGFTIEPHCDSCGRRGYMTCGTCDNDE